MQLVPAITKDKVGFIVFRRPDESRFEVQITEQEYLDIRGWPTHPDGVYEHARLTEVKDGTYIDYGNGRAVVRVNGKEASIPSSSIKGGVIDDDDVALILAVPVLYPRFV